MIFNTTISTCPNIIISFYFGTNFSWTILLIKPLQNFVSQHYIMQRTQLKTAMCKTCGKFSKFERHVTAMGVGDLFMVIITFGLWLVLRELLKPKFCCKECGTAI
jgi:hypothetical protein